MRGQKLSWGDRIALWTLALGILTAVLVCYQATREDIVELKTEVRGMTVNHDKLDTRVIALEQRAMH